MKYKFLSSLVFVLCFICFSQSSNLKIVGLEFANNEGGRLLTLYTTNDISNLEVLIGGDHDIIRRFKAKRMPNHQELSRLLSTTRWYKVNENFGKLIVLMATNQSQVVESPTNTFSMTNLWLQFELAK